MGINYLIIIMKKNKLWLVLCFLFCLNLRVLARSLTGLSWETAGSVGSHGRQAEQSVCP